MNALDDPIFVFVYGTLRDPDGLGGIIPDRVYREEGVTTRGRLYAHRARGAIPYLVVGPQRDGEDAGDYAQDDTVTGTLLHTSIGSRTMAEVTDIEIGAGYSPQLIALDDGRRVWAYVWPRAMPPNWERIPGDWLDWARD